MADMAKVMLSEFEEMLVNNSDWILTKHTIIEKVSKMLSMQVAVINENFSTKAALQVPGIKACRPKISKGENYQQLPYVILDYPAIFSRTDVFALRTMFWWGKFISVSLHLSGQYKNTIQDTLSKNIKNETGPFYLSTGSEEWQHHFEESNYSAIALLSPQAIHKKIMQPSFIKVALKYDLTQWNNIDHLLKEAYSKMALILLPFSFQSGETDL